MKTSEFIAAVAAIEADSDIPAATEAALSAIARHYEACAECAQAFDDMEYGCIEDVIAIMERSGDMVADWICEGVA